MANESEELEELSEPPFDPIVEEIHQVREKIWAEVGYDWEALLKRFQRNNHLYADRLVTPEDIRKMRETERTQKAAEST